MLFIENRASLSAEKMSSLLYLYTPLISREALFLYEMLLTEKREKVSVANYLSLSGFSLDGFERYLGKLNEYDLVITYQKDKQYLLVIKEALSGSAFFAHAFYGQLLLHEIGEEEYQKRCQFFLKKLPRDGYQNISQRLTLGTLREENPYEKVIQPLPSKTLNHSFFDMEKFLQNVSDLLLPYAERTEENVAAIQSCSDLYNIPASKMRILLNNMRKAGNGQFDKKILFHLAANMKNEYREVKPGEYQVPTVLFLMNQQGGKEVTPADKQLLYSLCEDYKLNPEVINVLLEYCLQKHQQRLYKSYLSQVAADMHRVGVETAQQAKNFLYQKADHRMMKNKNSTTTKDVLPVYDDSQNPKVDLAELEKFFKEWK